jgi:phosphatidylglycerophosphatase A
MKQKALKAFVTWFGLGLSPKAPGTVGTLGAVVFSLLFLQWSWWLQIVVILILAVLGIIACQMYEDEFEVHDAGEMVIDEVVGYLIAVFWLPLTWQSLLGAFVLFRVLDITKPLIIGMADKKLKGGLGVMADDILAGIVSGLVMQYVLQNYPQLLGV